jgi:hypothetical protein
LAASYLGKVEHNVFIEGVEYNFANALIRISAMHQQKPLKKSDEVKASPMFSDIAM